MQVLGIEKASFVECLQSAEDADRVKHVLTFVVFTRDLPVTLDHELPLI